jgi:hypothetical protein
MGLDIGDSSKWQNNLSDIFFVHYNLRIFYFYNTEKIAETSISLIINMIPTSFNNEQQQQTIDSFFSFIVFAYSQINFTIDSSVIVYWRSV